MELKTNDPFGKVSTITPKSEEVLKTKKVVARKQPNKIETKNKSDNSDNLNIRKNKPDVMKNRFPASANSISQRKENPVITTIGMDKYKDILSKFDPTLRINSNNKENVNSGSNLPKDLNNVKIQERMKVYLDTAKESSKLKTSTVDPLLGQLRGESSENNDADFSEKVDDDEDGNIEESHDELKISMEDHHEDSQLKDNDSNEEKNNSDQVIFPEISDKSKSTITNDFVTQLENKQEEIKESH
jgi:hypothetical protein